TSVSCSRAEPRASATGTERSWLLQPINRPELYVRGSDGQQHSQKGSGWEAEEGRLLTCPTRRTELLRNYRQQDMAGMLRVMEDRLIRGHVLRLGLIVASRVQVSRPQRETCRRNLDAQARAGGDGDAGMPQVERIFVHLARLEQL